MRECASIDDMFYDFHREQRVHGEHGVPSKWSMTSQSTC